MSGHRPNSLPWTAFDSQLKALERLFSRTNNVIKERVAGIRTLLDRLGNLHEATRFKLSAEVADACEKIGLTGRIGQVPTASKLFVIVWEAGDLDNWDADLDRSLLEQVLTSVYTDSVLDANPPVANAFIPQPFVPFTSASRTVNSGRPPHAVLRSMPAHELWAHFSPPDPYGHVNFPSDGGHSVPFNAFNGMDTGYQQPFQSHSYGIASNSQFTPEHLGYPPYTSPSDPKFPYYYMPPDGSH
ncbi:uncharacterized protein JCM6883_000589 [Sporobolomyces salmoneus]|uniref:uncharacterized protein n=1 Tax=Sporobolomyces salmoneus TaxID=183962 RepID=UPI00317A3804